jgi:hypothetical protein
MFDDFGAVKPPFLPATRHVSPSWFPFLQVSWYVAQDHQQT